MDIDAKTVSNPDPGLPLPSSISEARLRIAKRKWVRDNFDTVFGHMQYHRGHKEVFAYPREELMTVGDEEGSHEIA